MCPVSQSKPKNLKVAGVYLQVPEEEIDDLPYFEAKIAAARKHEKKLRVACQNAFAESDTAGKKKSKTYLSSKRVSLAWMHMDAEQRHLRDRPSPKHMYELSLKGKPLTCLDESVKVYHVQKSSGLGWRTIQSFGPVARAAQRAASELLRMTYTPGPFQFTDLSSAQKVQYAMSLIKKEGYTHVLELDIKEFYPSFAGEKLEATLPLPKEAVRHIVMAMSAQWVSSSEHSAISSIYQAAPGIPQGSVSSSEVGLWCVSHLEKLQIEDVDLINHADNFFVLAKSAEALEEAAKALSAGIAGLPGGPFTVKTEQVTTVDKGFRMLGCWVWRDGEDLLAEPTDLNIEKLCGRFSLECQRLHAKFTVAAEDQDLELRFESLQDYLLLESYLHGWVESFKFCGSTIKLVEQEYQPDLDAIRHAYSVKTGELDLAKDASTTVKIEHISKS